MADRSILLTVARLLLGMGCDARRSNLRTELHNMRKILGDVLLDTTYFKRELADLWDTVNKTMSSDVAETATTSDVKDLPGGAVANVSCICDQSDGSDISAKYSDSVAILKKRLETFAFEMKMIRSGFKDEKTMIRFMLKNAANKQIVTEHDIEETGTQLNKLKEVCGVALPAEIDFVKKEIDILNKSQNETIIVFRESISGEMTTQAKQISAVSEGMKKLEKQISAVSRKMTTQANQISAISSQITTQAKQISVVSGGMTTQIKRIDGLSREFDNRGKQIQTNTLENQRMKKLLKKFGAIISWAPFNGSVYKLFNEAVEWPYAGEKCSTYGAHLADITSPEEHSFVNTQLGRVAGHNYWIGGYKIDGVRPNSYQRCNLIFSWGYGHIHCASTRYFVCEINRSEILASLEDM